MVAALFDWCEFAEGSIVAKAVMIFKRGSKTSWEGEQGEEVIARNAKV